MIQVWLQKNCKALYPLYKLSSKVCCSTHSFYPDENHTQAVQNFTHNFESLMNLFQSGAVLHQDLIKQNQKTKVEVIIDEEQSKLQISQISKKEETDFEGGIQDKKENKYVTLTVHSARKKFSEPIEFRGTGRKGINKLVDTSIKNKDKTCSSIIEREIYPKWQEEFKDGCKLFGISIDEGKTIIYNHGIKGNMQMLEDANVEINPLIVRLEELFNKVLYLLEISWQRDFSIGYSNTKAIVNIGDLVKLMNNLPYMELYHWYKLNRKWLDLRHSIELNWGRNIVCATEEIKKYLEDTIDEMSIKFHITSDVTEEEVLKGFSKNSTHLITLEEFMCQQDEQINKYEFLKKFPEESNQNPYQMLTNKKKLKHILNEGSSCSEISDSEDANSYYSGKKFKNEKKTNYQIKGCKMFSYPPGMMYLEDMANKIYEENWR